jgi:hypothetical protein
MSEDNELRSLFNEPEWSTLIYHPPTPGEPIAFDIVGMVKFAQRQVILDDWYLIGGTRWSRMLFRLKHPIVYSKRGLYSLYRRIKNLFKKEKSLHAIPKRKESTRQPCDGCLLEMSKISLGYGSCITICEHCSIVAVEEYFTRRYDEKDAK